jgi:S-adenosylmethionine hydrolase
MARPVIALLTDFGTRDHYVGAMKGVILDICPDAVIVDITHDIPPHDVAAGALELAAAYRFFPQRTVFLAVVDPGVGSDRRAIGAEAGGWLFAGPDNGVLGVALAEQAPRLIVELGNPRYARPTVSRTFEGRDRFAPAAAWLARGVPLEEFGPPLAEFRQPDVPKPTVREAGLDGQVVRVDRFGNLITNIRGELLHTFRSGDVAIQIGARDIPGVAETYSAVAPGALCAVIGSSDHLEIAVNGGSAARELGVARGAVVTIRARRAGERDRRPT